jgi:tetratricopeptide (TPR) repeat protein
MQTLAARFPGDHDAAVLASDAAMNLSPWNYWNADGTPRPGTAELVARLEQVVAAAPDHPGACHFYIHALEPVEPAKALPCAERLASLMPGAGHLVHMPAHIYMRLGMFDQAVEHNVHGVEADEAYMRGQRPRGVYPTFYYPHNWHFLSVAASMAGRSAEAIRAGRRTAAAVPLATMRELPPIELYAPAALVMLARFGRWEQILAEPAPAPDLRYLSGMWRYARGLAYVETGRNDSARVELDSVRAIANAVPAGAIVGLNSSRTLLTIATEVLDASLAAREGRTDQAVRALTRAVRLQDGLTYDEPPPWYYPVRESLGAVLLRAGRAAEAEAVFREDLRKNPGSGWSLYGLARALRAQGNAAAADSADRAFRRAWARADVQLGASTAP